MRPLEIEFLRAGAGLDSGIDWSRFFPTLDRPGSDDGVFLLEELGRDMVDNDEDERFEFQLKSGVTARLSQTLNVLAATSSSSNLVPVIANDTETF